MSFILEALRKSEQERQRHQSPGMADLQARSRSVNRRYWLPLVIFLVGLNIGLLLFLWINGAPPKAPAAAAPAAVETPATAAAPTPQPQVNAAAEPIAPVANSAPALAAPADTAQPAAAGRELASELVARPAPAVAGPAMASATGDIAPPRGSEFDTLPTLTELTLAGSIELAPLHIDMHVYSPQPAERFVSINMRKYHEGDDLREGPVLKTITEDGVVLNYQGRSFLVTRE